MTKKWIKRLLIAVLPVLLLGLFAAAVAFDFERTMSFADLPPKALDNMIVTIKPYYGNTETIELTTEQKLRMLEAVDELETRGLRFSAFSVAPEDKGYSITLHNTGKGTVVITAAPGMQQIHTLEGGWFKHNLGDTQELNRYVYRLIEDAQNK